MRDSEISFGLPFVRSSLASNDDIFDRCGPLIYTIDIDSKKPGGEPMNYGSAIVITMKSNIDH